MLSVKIKIIDLFSGFGEDGGLDSSINGPPPVFSMPPAIHCPPEIPDVPEEENKKAPSQ